MTGAVLWGKVLLRLKGQETGGCRTSWRGMAGARRGRDRQEDLQGPKGEMHMAFGLHHHSELRLETRCACSRHQGCREG